MDKSCLVLVPPGFEEIEVVTPVDILRRAKVKVTLAGVGLNTPWASGKHGMSLQVDTLFSEGMGKGFDSLLLPGGPGVQTLLESEAVITLVKTFHVGSRPIGAICAAPLVLYKAGILEGKKYTAHFSVSNILTHIHLGSPVIVDHNLITANGPGAAFAFGLELLSILSSRELSQDIASSMCYMAF
jgi:protein deglycase